MDMQDSQASGPGAHPADTPSARGRSSLGSGLRGRHLVMMSLGSAIGAGLFVGSGAGVATAGPAILLSYVIAGIVVLVSMRALGEMVAQHPSSGAFSVYAQRGLGPAVGFMIGWLWWVQLCVVIAAESTAAAQLLVSLWPIAPQWLLALVFMVVFTLVNLLGVRQFGEFEFWFSMIKILAVLAFLVIGVLFILGLTPGASPGLSNLTEHGGFMPTGPAGIAQGLLIVAFAFGGIEIVAVAAAETDDPARNVTAAVHTIIWRILIFYMGSVAVMVIALPWNSEQLAASPFVAVLDQAGLPQLGAVLGVIIVLALLSSLNANLYGASRMIYSLSERSLAPAGLHRLSSRRVPLAAVLSSVAIGFIGVLMNYLWAEAVLGILLNVVGSTLLVTWIVSIVAHLRLRRRAQHAGEPWPVRGRGFPVLNILALVIIAAIVLLGLTDPAVRTQILSTGALVLVLILIGVWATRRPAARAAAQAEEAEAQSPAPGPAAGAEDRA